MEHKKRKMVYRGYEQLKAIIGEIMDIQEYPKFDFLNGVLSCKEVLGDKELWFWFGELRIVTPEAKEKELKAGDLETLEEWNTENDGTITLIGGSK